MPNPIVIGVKTNGAQQSAVDLNKVAQSLENDARAATHLAQTMAFAAREEDALAKRMARSAQGRALALRQQAADAKAAARAATEAARDEEKAQRQAARAAADAAKQAKNAGDTIVASMNQSSRAADRLVSRLHQVGGAINDAKKQGSAYENLGEARDFGAKVGAVGAAGLMLSAKTATDAGAYNKVQNSYAKALGEEQGAAFMQEVRKSDYAKVFGQRETMVDAAQKLTVGGFTKEDLLNKQGTGLYQTVGAMAAANPEADPAGVREAMRQISQIKRKTKAEKNDLDVIAESGGIDIYGLISAKFGQQRTTEVLSGDKPLTYTELKAALDTIPQYQNGMYKDSLSDAANSLPGQIQTLDGALSNLSQTVGQGAVPVVSFLAQAATFLADTLSAIPQPILTILVVLGLFGSGLLTLVGVVMVLTALYGQYVIGLEALKASVIGNAIATRAATIGYGTLAIAILGGIAVLLIAAWSWKVGAENAAKASKMSETEWRKAGGVMLSVSRAIGDAIDWIGNKISKLRQFLHLGGQDAFDEDMNRRNYEEDKKRLAKSGKTIESYEDWKKKRDDKYKTMSDGDKEQTAKDATAAPAPGMASGASQTFPETPEFNTTSTGILPSAQQMAVPSGLDTSTATYTAGAGGDIRSMMRQARFGGLDKDQKRAMQMRIFDAQTAKQLEALEARKAHKDEIAAKKAEREKERAAKKAQHAEEKAADEAAAHQRKIDDQLHREKMQQLRAYTSEQIKQKKMTHAEAQRLLNQEQNAYNRSKIGGMDGSDGLGATSTSTLNTTPFHNKYSGYANTLMGGMPQADAAKWIAKMSYGHRTNNNPDYQMGQMLGAAFSGSDLGQVRRVEGFKNLDEENAMLMAYQHRFGAGWTGGAIDANGHGSGIPQMPAYRGYSGPQGGYNASDNASRVGGAKGAADDLSVEISPETQFAWSPDGQKLIVKILPSTKEVPVNTGRARTLGMGGKGKRY